jgi:ribosomal protein S18 acetylase RimI-like enzyme
MIGTTSLPAFESLRARLSMMGRFTAFVVGLSSAMNGRPMNDMKLATILNRGTLAECPSIGRILRMLPSVDELLALDALTLREHTERAGDVFDIGEHQVKLQKSLQVNEVCSVRREGKLVAYAMLRQDLGARWFVGAFGTHPLHRTYAVMTELLTKIATVANERGISELKGHVYKTNRLSVAFHRKLGFQVSPEDIRCKLYLEQHGSWSKHLPSMKRATNCRPRWGNAPWVSSCSRPNG